MTPCPGCHRHLRDDATTCPFCGAAPRSKLARTLNTVGGAVTALVLAACYGTAYKPDDSGDSGATTAADVDNDGYPAATDCNDNDASIHPDAVEDCTDTVDDDCDGKIDADDTDCAAK